MSRNGSGVYSLPSANYPAVTGETITATDRNAIDSDIASALTGSMAVNGESVVTADIPLGTNKITGLKTGTAASDAVNLGQVQSASFTLLGSVSGADTITATLSPSLASYASGQMLKLIPVSNNTGAVTININGLGAKAVTKIGSTALEADDLVSGQIYLIEYDGTRFQVVNIVGDTDLSGKADINGDSSEEFAVAADAFDGDWENNTGAARKGDVYDKISSVESNGSVSTETTKTATGAVVEFTGLPADMVEFSPMLDEVSTTGTDKILYQLGTSSGYDTTGYESTVSTVGGTTSTDTTGFAIANSVSSGDEYSGYLTVKNITGNKWLSSGQLYKDGGTRRDSSGRKEASDVVDRVRFLVDGSNTFDGGIFGLSYKTEKA